MAKSYGAWPLNLAQLGRESTAGTPVAATTIWRGVFASPEDDRQRQIVEEDIGILVPAERSYDTALGVNIPMPATPLTFEQVMHILEAGVETPSPSGSGTYTRIYDYPFDGSNNVIKTYTLRLGNNTVTSDVQIIPYAYVTEFTLEGKNKEAWMMSATWRGQQMTDGSFTGSLSLPAVTDPALFGKTVLYMDATGGTIGTTAYPGVLMAASIKVKTGVVEVPVGDGNLYFTGHKFTKPEITFSLTFELEQDTGVSVVNAQRTKAESNLIQLFRLTTPGASPRNLALDFAGKWDKVGPYNKEGDGNTTVQFDGHVVYSSADALFWKATVINTLATVP